MKRSRLLTPILTGAAAALLGLNTTASAADTTNLVSITSYEDAVYNDMGELVTPDTRARWPWAYEYQWGYEPDPKVAPTQDTMTGEPADAPTNTVNRVNFDTSAYANPPAGAGFGQGFGAGMNWLRFDAATNVWPTNLQHYIVSFDARAEGLNPGVSTINIQMETQFDAPDDTIQPADTDSGGDRVIQVNKVVAVGSNWTHFVYTLNDFSSIGGGSEENLAKYAAAMNSVNYNVNVHQPSDAFGYDSDNYIVIDNIKLQVVISTNRPPPPPETTPHTISDWNFDDRDTWFSYGYGYSPNNVANPSQTNDRHAPGEGVGGSNAWVMTMDNTIFIGLEPKPAWAGVGTGSEGQVETNLMTTADLASYRITFSSRAEGLAPDVLSTTARLQLLLRGPDDSLEPADSNTEDDTLIRLDFDVPAQTNWVTTSYLLSKGSVGGGSKANLTNYFTTYAALKTWRPQFQIENPINESIWGYDNDNKLVVDNLKLERLLPVTAPGNSVSISAVNNQITVSWPAPASGTVKLLSTGNLNGTWTEVPTTGNSYTTTPTGTSRFYRTQVVP